MKISGSKNPTIKAYYKRNKYLLWIIASDLNNGHVIDNNSNYYASYKYGKELTITATTESNYYFYGWYEADKQGTITNNLISDKSEYTFTMPAKDCIYVALVSTIRYEVSVDNQTSGATITGEGKYTSGQEVKLLGTGVEDGYILAWYNNGKAVHLGDSYTITIQDEPVNLTVKQALCDDVLYRVDDKVYFGRYPQSQVSNMYVYEQLYYNYTNPTPTETEFNGWTSYGYYECNEQKNRIFYKDVDYDNDGRYDYRGVYLLAHRMNYTFEENVSKDVPTEYKSTGVSWFSYDPIEWTLLGALPEDTTYSLLVSSLIIDSQPFSNEGVDYAYEHNGKEGYANNYELSYIRQWLIDTFYNTAFNELEKSAMHSIYVDNSIKTTGDANNQYVSGNTSDMVTLPSVAEYNTFVIKEIEKSAKTTLYANSQNAYTGGNYGKWRLRTPSANNARSAKIILDDGSLESESYVDNTTYGIRPMIAVSLQRNKIKNIKVIVSDENAGSVSYSESVTIGHTTQIDVVSNPGYIFDGFYEGDNLVSSNIAYSFKMPNKDVTYTAKWIKVLTINVEIPEGGTIEGIDRTYEIGETITLQLRSKDGYTLNGVLCEFPTHCTPYYGGLTQYSFEYAGSDQSITVRWSKRKITHQIQVGDTIIYQSGLAGRASYVYDYPNVYIEVEAYDGYTFKNAKTAEGEVFDISSVPSGPDGYDVIVCWSANSNTTYTVHHYVEKPTGGYEFYSTIYETGTSNALSNATPLDIDGYTANVINQRTIKGDGTTQVFVFYSINTYQLTTTYNAERGSVSGNKIKYKAGEDISLTATIKDGYAFMGWYNNNTLLSTDLTYTTTMPTEDLEIEARFVPFDVTIDVVLALYDDEIPGKVTIDDNRIIGQNSTVTATAFDGYEFVCWEDGQGHTISEELTYTFVLQESGNYVMAKFKK